MPIAYVLINSDLGTDESIIKKLKDILSAEKDVKFEIQGVYGIYDIILKLTSSNTERLRSIITLKSERLPKFNQR